MDNYRNEHKDKPKEFMLTPISAIDFAPNNVQTMFCKKNSTTELSSDFTLPDYLPEIRKMLKISSRISPLSRYIGGNNAEFSGRIDYELLYCDSDGRLNSALVGNDFSFDVTLDIPPEIDINAGIEALAETETDMLHCRVLAPRKINIKCRLQSNVRAYGNTVTDAEVTSSGNTERLNMPISCCRVGRFMSEIYEIGDEVIPEMPADNMAAKPISCTANVILSEYSASDEIINCRGEIALKLLCEYVSNEITEEGNSTASTVGVIWRKVPFSAQIEASGISADCECVVYGNCGEVKMSEADGKILLDTEMILHADTFKNTEVEVTQDIFSTAGIGEPEYRDFSYETHLENGRCKATASNSLPISSTQLASDAHIIDSIGTARFDSYSFDNNKCKMNGICKMWVLAVNDKNEYSSSELNIPFECTAVVSASANPSIKARTNILGCACHIEGEQIICDAEIETIYTLTDKNNIKIVSCADFSSPKNKTESVITVYYPSETDTLWSIAKRYSIPLRTLAELNNLPSLKGEERVGKPFFIISK